MSEWTETLLGDLIEIKHGFAFKGEYFQDEPNGYVLLTPGNFKIGGGFKEDKLKFYNGDIPEDYVLLGGELIVTMTDLSKGVDTLGYSAIVPADDENSYLHNQRIGLVIPKYKNVYLPFIYWLMRSPEYRWHIIASASGSTVSHTSPTRIQEFTFDIPSPPEQEAIASILSSLEDKINLLRHENETLEEMAETLFRAWIAEDYEEDWEEKPLDTIAEYLNGIACQKYPPQNERDKLPVLKIRDLRNGISDASDWASTDVPSEYFVQNGDVIFSWSGSLMVKIWDGKDCILNQHLFKVTSSNYPKWFYYFWTKHHLNNFIAIAAGKATTMGHIKRSDLSNSMTLIPTSEELAAMDKVITPMIDKLIINNHQINTLEELRDTLLPKLISGEVRVTI
ncbi:restriction endonuclease subunit S [bacterium]|nr:restriction endonuclease subunit S [bacterium]